MTEPAAPPQRTRLDAKPDLPAIERRILARWADDQAFEASVEARQATSTDGSDNEYVFYDGPPFANGLPHYGHLLTGYVKDVIPRYQTMRGRRVERRFGWDCHGLPAEMEAEKELGVSGRVQITDYGIDRFNDACRTSVLRYTAEWERYVTRQARWVDFDNDYKTLDLSYMESVIWAFKQLWDQGLIYEAHRVMPYSWGAETPLSNFEIRLDDATRPRQDPAITVAFELTDPVIETLAVTDGPTEIWAWTTTPWTLPSNLALAVGPELTYDVVRSPERGGRLVVIGSSARERYAAQLGEGAEVVATLTGAELHGRSYRPLLPYFADAANAFVVLADDYVSDEDGTGIVHNAPGFGEDDQRVCEAAGIALVVPVDDSGRFTDDIVEWAGQNVFDANPDIIRALKERDRVVRHDTYDHNYPHCWRTDTPIIYRAQPSWYVQVTAIKDRLVAANQEINWIPDHVRDGQFGKWLEGARDWSISRNRFWGSPIPVWRSDDPAYPRTDAYGSLDEIEADFGVRLTDLHRPTVDALVRPNPDDPTGRSMMRRVPEVLDCWFESGSMPFAQVHYPFEAKDWFDTHSPADFIVEYIAQTRGWFYTLHVLSVALFDRPAFRNVICHGVVLDAEGRKLSKKLRNYPDPEEIMETIGSDPLRWYLMSSPILRGGDLRIAQDGAGIADVVRLVINPIWNAASFLTRYAEIDGYQPTVRGDAPGLLDRYLLAKTHDLVATVTDRMDTYDVAGACHEIVAFLDALNNWYIRRSRDRFWAPGSVAEGTLSDDKHDAYDTLHTVLTNLLRLTAPLLPLISEELWSALDAHGESVHLADWPDAEALPADVELVAAMDRARAVCSAALGLREDHGLRTRLPLRSMTVAGATANELESLTALLTDEVNVKTLRLLDDAASIGEFVLRPNSKVLGPKVGGAVQAIIKAAKAGDWTADGDRVEVAGFTLEPGEFELALVATDGVAASSARMLDAEGRSVELGLIVSIDTEVDAELEAEGLARDVIRAIQQRRKELDLHITDRIDVTIDGPERIAAAVRTHLEAVQTAVLATSVDLASTDGDVVVGDVASVDGEQIGISVSVAHP